MESDIFFIRISLKNYIIFKNFLMGHHFLRDRFGQYFKILTTNCAKIFIKRPCIIEILPVNHVTKESLCWFAINYNSVKAVKNYKRCLHVSHNSIISPIAQTRRLNDRNHRFYGLFCTYTSIFFTSETTYWIICVYYWWKFVDYSNLDASS